MNRLLLLRRTLQVIMLVVLPLLPLLEWIHIDVDEMSLMLFGFPIWAHETTIVVLLAAVAMALLAGLAAIGGRVFCGWLCPQTALSEFTASLESWIRRSLSGRSLARKLLAGGMGAAAAGSMSAIGGLAMVTFFVPPSNLASLLGPPLNTSLLKGLTMATILVFVVVVVFRHLFCEWICLFGWWQRLFAGPRSLRIVFDTGHSKGCTNCGGCRKACFMKLEPRKRQLPLTCLNCTQCVVACERELGPGSLISLRFPTTAGGRSEAARGPLGAVTKRIVLATLLITISSSALAAALISRQPLQVVVRQAERLHINGDRSLSGAFHVDVFNNLSQPIALRLDERGLEESQAGFMPSRLVVDSRGRARSDLRIFSGPLGLTSGRHTLTIVAVAEGSSGRLMAGEGRVVFAVPPMGRVGGSGEAGDSLPREERQVEQQNGSIPSNEP